MGEPLEDRYKYVSHPVEGIIPSSMMGLRDLMKAYRKMSFQARNLGRAASLLAEMVRDKDNLVVMTLAGALVPGGLRNTIRDAIENGLVDVIVSTGANISHDLVEAMGYHHYRHSELKSDAQLKAKFIDRVYDTFVSDKDFVDTAYEIEKHFPYLEGNTSDAITRFLGSIVKGPSILKSAYKQNVPIFVPALNDSELGLVINHYNSHRSESERIVWDGLQDNMRFAEIIRKAHSCGTLICGGGVPRNWAQQVTPLLEYLDFVPGEWTHKFSGYKYGILITTDTPVYGGLSGCTFSESISWGKYTENVNNVTVNCDVTIALPLVIGAAIEELREDN